MGIGDIGPDFLQELEASEALFNRADHARSEMEASFRGALEKLRSVQQRIAAGGSSGDPITDFVFRYRLAPTLAMVRRYHGLNDAITAHQGEFVLVIEREEVDSRWHPHLEVRPEDYRLRVWCAVGVINGAGLLLDMVRGVSAIPTGKHLMFSNDFPVLIGGDVLEPNRVPFPNPDHIRARTGGRDLGASLGIPLTIHNPRTREVLGDSCPAIEAHIGDPAVSIWFQQNGLEAPFQQVAGYFGRPLPAPAAA